MLKKRVEKGQSTLVFALGMVVLMWLLIGLMDDLGRLALAEIRALDAVELAAQDAANWVDTNIFWGAQEVKLSPAAMGHAQQTASALSDGRVTLGSLGIAGGGRVLVVSADLEVPLKWMARVGVPVGRRTFRVSTTPSYGLQVENE